ncbi:MAG: hypothetical protein GY898_29140 [Proteobacteria bacterium]|nr:hypothetical protein [Pseudomonadota bacterium]
MSGPPDLDAIARRHLTFGWWALLIFLLVGSVLESLHGFKVAWYVDVATETRRLVWRLGHAHGTMLSIVNIVFGLTIKGVADRIGDAAWPVRASQLLVIGTVLLPGGFFAGGLVIYGGDPGPGVFVAPFGALALAIAMALTATGLSKALKD